MANNTNNTNELYQVVHSSPEIKTVIDYITQNESPASQYSIKDETGKDGSDDFLAIVGPDDLTNRQRIEANFINSDDKKTIGNPATTLALKTGTILYIPVDKINRIGLLTEGIQVVSNSTQSFQAQALVNLMTDTGYQSIVKPIEGKLQKGTFKKQFPNCTVWVWCRSLSSPDQPDGELKGQIFNISPFIEELDITVGKNGGNFQLKLPPLTCELINNVWTVKKGTIVAYASKDVNKKEYFSKDFINQRSGSVEYKRNDFLFHTIISSNDLVFIRFETLVTEEDRRTQETDFDFIISESNLPGCIFDMIGLVDSNSLTVTPASNDVTVNIRGRDLSKLFIDDGTYFYPLEFSQGQLNFAGGSTDKNVLMQRVFSDNALNYLGLYFNQSIEHVLKFVIQQLSTIKVAPDDLFFYYPEKNTKPDLTSDPKNKSKNIDLQYQSQLQQAKEGIAITRTKNGYQLNTDIEEKAMIEKVLREMIRFFETIIKGNIGSIIGWKGFVYANERDIREDIPANYYSYFFTQQLYTSPKYISDNISQAVINSIKIKNSRPQFTGQIQQNVAPGIWQIVFLVIDDSVTNRRIVDSSISSANGSLLNFIQKVCQEPFVEFNMDTYGDKFYLTVRKPPFDATAIRSAVQGQWITENGQVAEAIPPIIIDIDDSDVISENLDYDGENAISWYHFTPQSSFFGDSNNYSLAYIPAVFFPEYAEIWGSRPLQLVNNYTPFLFLDKQDKNALNIIEKQAFEDLKYMIESNAYIPFTRKGTITLNGDRRIKRGTFIRYKATGEIFYVEMVHQKYSIGEKDINRSTTLQVSRGMIERFIYGQTIPGITTKVSYFDIIDTTLNTKTKVTQQTSKVTNTTVLKDDSKTSNRNYVNEMSVLAWQQGFYSIDATSNTNSDTKHYLGQFIDVNITGKSELQIISFMDFMRGKGYMVVDKRPLSQDIHIEITNQYTNTPSPTVSETQVDGSETTNINRDQLLNNFKVNVPVFNFFLKRLQQGNKALYYVPVYDNINKDNSNIA